MADVLNLYAGKKVLVTGASGFIGSHLCERLRDNRADIHAVSRSKSHQDSVSLRWWRGDLSDAAWVHHLVQAVKPDVIFHLAGEVSGSRNRDCVARHVRDGLLSTVNLLTAASEVGCQRFVQAGSLEEPEPSEIEVVPCSPYAAAKWAGSSYARMFHSLYKLPTVVARIFMTYGPAQRDLSKLIPYVVSSLLRGEAPRLSSGTRLVDFIYVKDVADGLLYAGCVPAIEGATVDLGSGQMVSIRAVIELLIELVHSRVRPLFGAMADRPMEQIRAAKVTKTEALLGWKPTISLREGLQQTIEWYSQNSPNLAIDRPQSNVADCARENVSAGNVESSSGEMRSQTR